MNEVKRVEAWGLIADLRNFGFEQSAGFAQGRQNGLEVTKAFYHQDPVPDELLEATNPHCAVSQEYCKSSFTYTAFRVPGKNRKPGYTFSLRSAVERSLSGMPDRILRCLSPNVIDYFDGFAELEEGALCEAQSTEFETSTYERGKITVSHKYAVTYTDEPVYETSDDEILFGVAGTFESIPYVESSDNAERLFVQEPIPYQRIEGAENVATNLGFWTIVDPFQSRAHGQSVAFRDAARRMIAITQVLKSGELPG